MYPSSGLVDRWLAKTMTSISHGILSKHWKYPRQTWKYPRQISWIFPYLCIFLTTNHQSFSILAKIRFGLPSKTCLWYQTKTGDTQRISSLSNKTLVWPIHQNMCLWYQTQTYLRDIPAFPWIRTLPPHFKQPSMKSRTCKQKDPMKYRASKLT